MKRRSWWLTAVGVLFTAAMLFPVYWMINVSLTKTSNMRKSPPNLIPIDGTLQGYSVVLHQQLPYLGTSLFIGLGTVKGHIRDILEKLSAADRTQAAVNAMRRGYL